MKTIRINYIFALVFGISLLTVSQASNAGTNNDEKNISGTILLSESEVEFTSYIGKVLPEYVLEKNWSIINKIVTLYNQSPSKIRELNLVEINLFNSAVLDLSNKLEVVNDKDALLWKSDLDKTTNSIRFIRNFDINTIAGDKLEIPVVKVPNSFKVL